MQVRVVEARRHGLAFQVQDLRFRADVPLHVTRLADRHKPPVADGKGLRLRARIDDRKHVGIQHDQVGRGLSVRCSAPRRGEAAEPYRHSGGKHRFSQQSIPHDFLLGSRYLNKQLTDDYRSHVLAARKRLVGLPSKLRSQRRFARSSPQQCSSCPSPGRHLTETEYRFAAILGETFHSHRKKCVHLFLY